MQRKSVIILGDSTNNTLSVVRSLGQAGVEQTLILKTDDDYCNVAQSKYLRRGNVITVSNLTQCVPILDDMPAQEQLLICTFDEAAMWVDEHEESLSKKFLTPCRGRRIGPLFSKDAQCDLARQCGLTVPRSVIFTRGEQFPPMEFPLLLKPLVSAAGEKSDIHICRDSRDLQAALGSESTCSRFVVQEFIEKDYELDCVGISTDDQVIISGAIRKIRHYPPLIGAGAYGEFIPIDQTNVDTEAVTRFIRKSNYHGPFSVEFLHTANDKNYFMEVNFRNEGLAYASTCAGANLHAVYAGAQKYDAAQVRPTFMMNYSLDFLYVKSGQVTLAAWLRDLARTRCFINFSLRDPMPTLHHYLKKIHNK